jgi:formylmethanofuran dehydrogenase subunit E
MEWNPKVWIQWFFQPKFWGSGEDARNVIHPEYPPPDAKKRGAIVQVKCGSCGKAIWRRRKEVREGNIYTCLDCRKGAAEDVEKR